MTTRDHTFYVESLAEHERRRTQPRAVFTEFTLGPTGQRRRAHPGRADVASLRISWRHREFNIFEVKASRSDFLSDIRSDKWRKYLKYCTRFYFAVPEGIVKSTELADEAGLVIYKAEKDSWFTVRHPKRQNPEDQSNEILRAMVFYLHEVEHPIEQRARRISCIYTDTRKDGMALSRLLALHGHRHIGRLQRKLGEAERKLAAAQFHQRVRLDTLDKHGLPSDPWELDRELRELKHEISELKQHADQTKEKP